LGSGNPHPALSLKYRVLKHEKELKNNNEEELTKIVVTLPDLKSYTYRVF